MALHGEGFEVHGVAKDGDIGAHEGVEDHHVLLGLGGAVGAEGAVEAVPGEGEWSSGR